MRKEKIRRHFEETAGDYDRWKEKSSYYYDLLAGIYKELIPPGSSVLEIGCGTGTLLSRLSPKRGVGIDFSQRMIEIASSKYPHLTFLLADAERFEPGETFGFIIVPDVIEHLADPGAMFRSARKCCVPDSRVIVTCVNPLWAPVLHAAEAMGLKMPEGEHRWLPEKELKSIALAAGLETAASFGRILLPKKIPLLSTGLNRAAERLAFLGFLCLTNVLVLVPR